MLSVSKQLPKTDLRVQKTERALINSMHSLLGEYRFTKLTVDRLCKEGQLSRATFYSHFTDKYDLLEFGLLSFWTSTETDAQEDMQETISQCLSENKKIIKNLLIDADQQTLEVVQNFLCLAFDVSNVKRIDGKIIQKNIVASNLYIGGIIYYLLWQVRNNFPSDVPIINEHSLDAINKLHDWAKEH